MEVRDRLGQLSQLARDRVGPAETSWGALGVALGIGAALGALVMYAFDPDRGRTRQGMARNGVAHLGHELEEMAERLEDLSRDLRNRLQGRAHQARQKLANEPVSDERLVERIRSKIGHCTDHPRNVMVQTHQGKVTLSGPIMAREVPALIACVSGIPGVREVANRMEIHELPGRSPGSPPML